MKTVHLWDGTFWHCTQCKRMPIDPCDCECCGKEDQPVKPWEDYTIGDIQRGINEIDRASGAAEIAELYMGRAHWLISCPPDTVADFASHLPPALCEHATFYADGGVATLMRITIPLGGLMLAGATEKLRCTLIVALPKEHVTQQAIERFLGEPVPYGADRTDVILLRDDTDRIPWPTMLVDAVMLADPHYGQAIIDAGEATE